MFEVRAYVSSDRIYNDNGTYRDKVIYLPFKDKDNKPFLDTVNE